MRLGDLLLRKGVITAEQRRTGLHEQKRFGGRLGTNLVQLGYATVDAVALALSEQQDLPPVLREHVAAIDKRVLALFPERVVTAYKAIPIGYTQTKPPRVVVACMDPATIPTEELAFAAGGRIEIWIAPEALIQECMERYFGAAPLKSRYVSVKVPPNKAGAKAKEKAAPIPETRPEPAPAPPVSKPVLVLEPPPPPQASRAAVRVLSPPPPPPSPAAAPEPSPPPPVPEPSPPPPPAPLPAMAASPSEPELPPEDDWDLPDAPAPIASIHPLTAPPEALRPVITRAEASMSIELATTKDQIGRVLEDWLRSTFGCGLVLVVKGDMAIGWRGFFADAEDMVEAVAIPLGKPSMFGTAYEARAPFHGPPPAEGAKVQERLWKLLRCAPPVDALVCPVVLGKRAVNLLYAQMEDGSPIPDDVVKEAEGLSGEAATAYARLIGRERKKK